MPEPMESGRYETLRLEKQLCTGVHRGTHLFYTRGEVCELRGVYSTFEMHQRRRQAEIIENDRAYYQQNLRQNRILIGQSLFFLFGSSE